jgi:hypothetical protein
MKNHLPLIQDLRKRFKDGATPSGLIQCILDYAGDTITYPELCDLLREAFRLPVVRISRSSLAPEHDHKGAILNRTLLTELVQSRSEWDAPLRGDGAAKPS